MLTCIHAGRQARVVYACTYALPKEVAFGRFGWYLGSIWHEGVGTCLGSIYEACYMYTAICTKSSSVAVLASQQLPPDISLRTVGYLHMSAPPMH